MVTPETGYIYNIYSQTWLKSHYLQHQPHYNNTHGRNGFSGLYKMSWLQQLGYNSTVPHISGTKGVVVNKFDCICTYIYIHTYIYTLEGGVVSITLIKVGCVVMVTVSTPVIG